MPIKFNTTIILTPNELNKNFESTILTKIKATLENSCSKHGYIKKDSIKIIKRTPGYIKESHFNGNIASVQWNIGKAFTDDEVLQQYNATK